MVEQRRRNGCAHAARSIWDKFTGALDGHINEAMTVNATGNVACDQSHRLGLRRAVCGSRPQHSVQFEANFHRNAA